MPSSFFTEMEYAEVLKLAMHITIASKDITPNLFMLFIYIIRTTSIATHAKMILRFHLGITNRLTRAFLLIIHMDRIVQIQVADNYAKRPFAANSEELL